MRDSIKAVDNTLKIKESLLNKNASLVGFADVSELPPDVRHSMNYAISIGVALRAAVVAKIGAGPTLDYYLEYKRVNNLLSSLGKFTADTLRNHGYEGIPLEPTSEHVDIKTLSTDLPHKTAATLAGLGWIGKSALLVTEEFGTAVRLITVLTDAEFETVTPVTVSRCGGCTACADSCPAKAHSGKNWNAGMRREELFDAFLCRRTARRYAERIDIDATICGICVAVCPWTKRYVTRAAHDNPSTNLHSISDEIAGRKKYCLNQRK